MTSLQDELMLKMVEAICEQLAAISTQLAGVVAALDLLADRTMDLAEAMAEEEQSEK